MTTVPLAVDDSPLTLTVTTAAEGVARISADGDLDVVTTPQLEEAITTCCASGADVELDLSGVSFADLAAFRTIMLASLGRQGCDSVQVVAASSAIRLLVDAALGAMGATPPRGRP